MTRFIHAYTPSHLRYCQFVALFESQRFANMRLSYAPYLTDLCLLDFNVHSLNEIIVSWMKPLLE